MDANETTFNDMPKMIGKHTIFRLDAHYSQTYLCAITK